MHGWCSEVLVGVGESGRRLNMCSIVPLHSLDIVGRSLEYSI